MNYMYYTTSNYDGCREICDGPQQEQALQGREQHGLNITTTLDVCVSVM